MNNPLSLSLIALIESLQTYKLFPDSELLLDRNEVLGVIRQHEQLTKSPANSLIDLICAERIEDHPFRSDFQSGINWMIDRAIVLNAQLTKSPETVSKDAVSLWVKQPVSEMIEEEAEYWRQHQPTKLEVVALSHDEYIRASDIMATPTLLRRRCKHCSSIIR